MLKTKSVSSLLVWSQFTVFKERMPGVPGCCTCALLMQGVWLQYEDKRVTVVPEQQVIDDNFGGRVCEEGAWGTYKPKA